MVDLSTDRRLVSRYAQMIGEALTKEVPGTRTETGYVSQHLITEDQARALVEVFFAMIHDPRARAAKVTEGKQMGADNAVEFKQKHAPYSDGSGHRYEVTVAKRHDGDMVILIEASGGVVEIAASDWPAVGQSIDDAAEFIRSRVSN